MNNISKYFSYFQYYIIKNAKLAKKTNPFKYIYFKTRSIILINIKLDNSSQIDINFFFIRISLLNFLPNQELYDSNLK